MELSIIHSIYELYKITIIINTSLQKQWKFSIGTVTMKNSCDLLEQIILAKNAPKSLRGHFLEKSQAYLEIYQINTRIMLEMKLCNETNLFKAKETATEIGRMLGGWIRATRK